MKVQLASGFPHGIGHVDVVEYKATDTVIGAAFRQSSTASHVQTGMTAEAAGQLARGVLNSALHSGATAHPMGEVRVPFDVPDSYAGNPHGRLHADPLMNGVYRNYKGDAYIKQGDLAFPIRYDRGNGTWRAHSQESPTKYAYPVKQDDNGAWHTHGDVGMAGGWPGDPLNTVNKVQHEISVLEREIHQLNNQHQQLTQRWDQTKSELDQFQRGGVWYLTRSETRAVNEEIANIHTQLIDVQQRLLEKNNRVRQLQQSLR